MMDWDTVMYKNQTVSSIRLPINSATDKMTYYLYYDNTVAMLNISYGSRTYALAPDCKAIDILYLTEAATTHIQDLKISQPNLASNVIENIKLYF